MSEPRLCGLRWVGLAVRRGRTTDLRFPDLELSRGEQAVVCGPSGSGKTTLLAALAGLLPFGAQQASVHGHDLVALQRYGGAAFDAFRARYIGLVPQQPLLLGAITVLENLLIAQRLAGVAADVDRARAQLDELGLQGLHARKPAALSRGQQQRVALARALINRPLIVLADEPTANLDDALAEQVIALLQRQASRHEANLLVTSHDARVMAAFPRRVQLA